MTKLNMSAMKKISMIFGGIVFSGIVKAETISSQTLVDRYYKGQDQLLAAWGIAICLLLVIILILTIEIVTNVKRLKEAAENPSEPVMRSSWLDLFRRTGKEDDFVKDHVYDGIREYDNSPPAWFNWLFYGTMVWAAGYMMYYHVFRIGILPAEAYTIQVKEAEKVIAKAQENAIRLADEPRYTDDVRLAIGRQTFKTNCVMCHGENGEGKIGPNLTDEYWIHGGTYKQVFTTIFNGVPEKGMLSWKKSLRPDDIRAVASYVFTLRNTHPSNPKPPQGVKIPNEPMASVNTQASL